MIRRREFITLFGGATAWPLAAHAQQPNVPVLGFLTRFRLPSNAPVLEAFRAGLAEGGFIEGRNLSIEYRWGNGNFSVLRSMAADLVHRQVAVIVTSPSVGPILVAKAATSTIPIVFIYGGDPVKEGIVDSLSRPGGNVTGITGMTSDLLGKRLDLLLKLVPQARKVGFISGPWTSFDYEQQRTSILAAGRALGVEIMIVECRDDRDFEPAVAKMVEDGAEAMILGAFPFGNLNKLVPLAALHKLPAIYHFRGSTRVGGLISYDTDVNALYRRLGSAYVARILKGAKPSDLPVEQPTKFNLAINLTTAKELGLTVPPTLFALADEVIE